MGRDRYVVKLAVIAASPNSSPSGENGGSSDLNSSSLALAWPLLDLNLSNDGLLDLW